MFEGTKIRRYGNWLIEIFPVEGEFEAIILHEELANGGPRVKGSYLTIAEAEAAAIYAIHLRVAEAAVNDWIDEMTQRGNLTINDFPSGAFPEMNSL